jgi:hypothetical protein
MKSKIIKFLDLFFISMGLSFSLIIILLTFLKIMGILA